MLLSWLPGVKTIAELYSGIHRSVTQGPESAAGFFSPLNDLLVSPSFALIFLQKWWGERTKQLINMLMMQGHPTNTAIENPFLPTPPKSMVCSSSRCWDATKSSLGCLIFVLSPANKVMELKLFCIQCQDTQRYWPSSTGRSRPACEERKFHQPWKGAVTHSRLNPCYPTLWMITREWSLSC